MGIRTLAVVFVGPILVLAGIGAALTLESGDRWPLEALASRPWST